MKKSGEHSNKSLLINNKSRFVGSPFLLVLALSTGLSPVVAVKAHSATTAAVQTQKTKKRVTPAKQVTSEPTTGVPSASTTTNPAFAQTTPSPITTRNATTQANAATLAEQKETGNAAETIVVTGSRLAHSSMSDIMPTTTIDAKQLQARGYANVGTALLRENPSYGAPDNSNMGSQGSFGAGQFLANLYDLGSQRTLTLVNGHRFVSQASSSIFGSVSGSPVDLGVIPTSLIKKVETVGVGGAPAYGSDAIAGVQNFILQDDFEGVSFTAQGGLSQKLDNGSSKIALLAGKHFDHDRGGIVFDLEYNNQLPLSDAARQTYAGAGKNSYGLATDADGNTPYSYLLRRGGRRYLEFTTSGMPLIADDYPTLSGQPYASVTNAAGNPLIFNSAGTALVPLTFNSTNGDQITGTGGNGFPLGNYDNLIVGQTRLNLTTLAHYDITDHLKATFEGWYQNSSAYNTAYQGYYNTALFGNAMTGAADGTQNGDMVLSTNNPFLTSSERNTITSALAAAGEPTDQFYMSRVNTDWGSGAFTTNTQTFRFVGGLSGDFRIGGRHFDWDVSGTYGRSISHTDQPQIVTQNLVNALNATTDASGAIVCAPGYTNAAIATYSSTCMPLNPFGDTNASQAAVNYITAPSHTTQTNSQFDIVAEVKSTIVKLPAGDVRWDLGYEHRREGFNFQPGAFYLGAEQPDGSYLQYGNSAPITPVQGSFHTHEVFAELDVPLISPKMHIPLAYSLSGNASARYLNNSITGGFWTYTAGGSYAPVRDIVFHGNYTRSLRAPSVTELFAPQGTSYETADDPCSAQFINSGPNPGTRAANCARAGVPAGLNSNIVNFTTQGKTGGNNGLQNESADSFTGGITFQPRFIPGLTLNSDFIDIDIRNEIVSLDAEQLMDACYDNPGYPNAYCSTFTRDSSGQVTSYTDGYFNVANQHMQGLQSRLNYYLPLYRVGLPISAGDIEMNVNYMHYVKNQQTVLGQVYDEVGSSSNPKDSFTANLSYYRGPLFLQWQTIYYGPSVYALNVSPNTYQDGHFKQWFTFNTTIGYTFLKHYSMNFNMNNVFNGRPQFPYTGSTSRYFDGIIGRSFQLTLQANF